MSGLFNLTKPSDENASAPGTTRITLRPAIPNDLAFLCVVYASTREDELAVTGWDLEQKRAFLDMQFDAQHRHYHSHFPDAAFDVIEIDGRSAGRLYVDRSEDEVHILDIALLPEQRGHGVGSQLLHQLLEEARIAGKRVLIHVERYNPALRLYTRLGFEAVGDDGVYLTMIWSTPESQPNTAS